MANLPNKQLSVPPIEFEVIGKNNKFSRSQIDWLSSLKPTLENTITNLYIQRPHVTQMDMATIAKPTDGMDFYDPDSNKACVRENGELRYYNTSSSPLANATPNITQTQRDSLTPNNGDIIINTTLNPPHGTPQMYIGGVWKNLTLT